MSVSSGWGTINLGTANWNENQKFGAGWGARLGMNSLGEILTM